MKSIFLFLFSLLILSSLAYSQYQKDAALWSHFRVSLPINNKWALELKLQERIANNVSRLDRVSSNANLKYKLHKAVQLEFAYGFMANQRLDGSFSLRHRIRTAVVLDKNIGQWSLSYRSLLQWRYKDLMSDEEGQTPGLVFRNRFKMKYHLNRIFTPYAAIESFSPLNGPVQYSLTKYRTQAGMLYHFNARLSMEAYYLFQQQLRSNNYSEQDHVYGIGLNLKL